MFGLFKQKYFLGVDFGLTSIKVVELKIEGGVAMLVNFGVADVREEDLSSGSAERVTQDFRRTQYLAALLEKMQTHTREAFVSIPGSSGLIAVVEFPKMNPEELADAVGFEAHKYVPIDINEVTLSWDILRPLKKEGTQEHPMEMVLLVAALKKDVEKTATAIQRVGYTVGAMELETFSLARSLVDGESGTHLIIDIGFRVSNLVLVSSGEVRMNRTVDVGGNDITKTIMDGMNISFDRAEALKKERDFFHQNEIPLTFPTVETLMSEVRRIITAFEQQKGSQKIDSLVLSGGTSALPGFAAYCQEQLNVPAVMGDPWKRVQYDREKLSESAMQDMRGLLTIALGLALRGGEAKKK